MFLNAEWDAVVLGEEFGGVGRFFDSPERDSFNNIRRPFDKGYWIAVGIDGDGDFLGVLVSPRDCIERLSVDWHGVFHGSYKLLDGFVFLDVKVSAEGVFEKVSDKVNFFDAVEGQSFLQVEGIFKVDFDSPKRIEDHGKLFDKEFVVGDGVEDVFVDSE